MDSKLCRTCSEVKFISEFGKDKNKKDGLTTQCKVCRNNKSKQYRDLHNDKEKLRLQQWRALNKDKVTLNNKKWNLENKESKNINYKNWYQNNKETKKISDIEWRTKNIEKVRKYHNKYVKESSIKNPLFKLKRIARRIIYNSFNNKNFIKTNITHEILGCSFEEFKQHLESLWEPWMNWDNYGNPKDAIVEPNKTWDIDHIIPLATAKTEDDVYRLNHYTNLQPLCSYVNRFVKRDN
jgi:hypothetical protein